MIPRPISLVVCLIAGYFLGNMLTWSRLIPVVHLTHPTGGQILTIATVGSTLGMLSDSTCGDDPEFTGRF